MTLRSCIYIVGDASGLAILDMTENQHHEKDLMIGSTVKLLKPETKDEQTIMTNKKFKPLQTKQTLKLKPSKEDLAKLTLIIEQKEPTEQKEQIVEHTTFASIRANTSQSLIPQLTVMVTSVSRLIDTKMGIYQIAGIMDATGDKISMSLYDSSVGSLEFGNTYTITKVKKSVLKKESGPELRKVIKIPKCLKVKYSC